VAVRESTRLASAREQFRDGVRATQVQMNEYQKSRFSLNMVRSMFNTVTGKKIAIFCVEINQCVGCTRQFFTKSFLGDDVAVLARSSG